MNGRDRRIPMRRLTPQEAVDGFAEVALGYSTEEAIAEANRAAGVDLAGARGRCPFGVDIVGMVRAIADVDFEAAYRTAMEAHPWPGILGRACHRSCEAYSDRADPEPIFISALERAA